MMKVQNDIYKYLFQSALVTWALVVVAVAAIVTAALSILSVHREEREMAYLVNSEGQVIPLKLAEMREADEIRVKQLLTLFVDYYYNLDQYNWYEKTNKALWLGNLKADRKNKEDLGYYTQFMQMDMKQKAVLSPEDIEIGEIEDGKFWFKIQIQLMQESPIRLPQKLLLFAQGTVSRCSLNFPYNPQGFYIDNFKEDQTIQIQE